MFTNCLLQSREATPFQQETCHCLVDCAKFMRRRATTQFLHFREESPSNAINLNCLSSITCARSRFAFHQFSHPIQPSFCARKNHSETYALNCDAQIQKMDDLTARCNRPCVAPMEKANPPWLSVNMFDRKTKRICVLPSAAGLGAASFQPGAARRDEGSSATFTSPRA